MHFHASQLVNNSSWERNRLRKEKNICTVLSAFTVLLRKFFFNPCQTTLTNSSAYDHHTTVGNTSINLSILWWCYFCLFVCYYLRYSRTAKLVPCCEKFTRATVAVSSRLFKFVNLFILTACQPVPGYFIPWWLWNHVQWTFTGYESKIWNNF